MNINITLSRPAGYSDRVSVLTVKISDPNIISNRIGFEVPVIEKWLFRPTERNEFYMAPLPDSPSPMRGVIIDGEWGCIAQSNGVSEEDNPVSREDMKKILTLAIEEAVLPFCDNG